MNTNRMTSTHPSRLASHWAFRLLLAVSILASGLAFSASPAQAAAPQAPAYCVAWHVVQPGENLFRIGLQYGLLWTSIAAANGIAHPGRIYAGQTLCIPAGGTGGIPGPYPWPYPWPYYAPVVVPTFTISGVVRDTTVSIVTANFPADTEFVVRMNYYGTMGIAGVEVATINSGPGGVLQVTFPIHASLVGHNRIAIRLEGANGYYAYNWFWNNTTN